MELQISDIQLAAQIIDIAVQRGAFRAAEAKSVGECYERIQAFLTEVAKQQEAQKAEAEAAAPATAPAAETVPADAKVQ